MTLLKDINPGQLYSNPSNFTMLNSEVYFFATSKDKGKELWKTDGTEAGTTIVKDINPNAKNGINTMALIAFNNKLYFFADDDINGNELWESDGTEAGTKLIKDINGLPESSVFNVELTAADTHFYFTANDGTNGVELWKSDGSEAGTEMVKDINPNGGANIRYLTFHPYLKKLYFSAYDGSGSNLWESDGTSASTFKQSVKNPSNFTLGGSRDIGDRSGPSIIYNTELYFSGESTSNFNKKGTELWAVTYIGAIQQVFDINPGTASSYPSYFKDLKGKLYFAAYTSDSGYELWKANGVIDAEIVKDIQSGSSNANIAEIGSFGDLVLFGAGDNSQNRELWKSDGTETGTVLLQDINPSTNQYGNGSNPNNFFTSGDVLYFAAYDGVTGNEPWMLEESALSVEKESMNSLVNLEVYPNPVSNILNIKADNQQIKSMRIVNVLGK